MSSSGVKCNPSVMEKFFEVKKRQYRFTMFKMNPDMSEIILDPDWEASSNQEDVLEEVKGVLKKEEPCWVVLDYRWELAEGGKRDKLLLIFWCPDTAHIKKKMVYASSVQFLAKTLEGIKTIQANDLSDLENRQVQEKAAAK